MIQYKLTQEGLSVMRYLPFIVLGQPIGAGADSREHLESSAPVGHIELKGGKNGERTN